MLIVHNPIHSEHAGRQEMFRGRLVPCHESPGRLDYILAEIQRRDWGSLSVPGSLDMSVARRIHSDRYLDFLAGAWSEWVALDPANSDQDILPSVWPVRDFRHDVLPSNFAARVGLFSFDSGTPMMAGTWAAATAGAACAIDAAKAVSGLNGRRAAMALTRPPGHHAGAEYYGGYCFLNNAALSAQVLLDQGARRVAIVDIDYHHGNGTQSIFYKRADVHTLSIHGDPATEYPFFLGYRDELGQGDGHGFNTNIPLPAGSQVSTWFRAVEMVLQEVMRYGADALVVALGVDTFEGDPISTFRLKSKDYLQVGRLLASARIPTVFVMEGGYAVQEIGINVANVLEGFLDA